MVRSSSSFLSCSLDGHAKIWRNVVGKKNETPGRRRGCRRRRRQRAVRRGFLYTAATSVASRRTKHYQNNTTSSLLTLFTKKVVVVFAMTMMMMMTTVSLPLPISSASACHDLRPSSLHPLQGRTHNTTTTTCFEIPLTSSFTQKERSAKYGVAQRSFWT